ncbi:synaptotagmin-9-like isoform X3 [Acropora millepora]|uniref:synaptotagmin-9-like isoform X3 n=1 Tax=Acropora millepora TaxID=45264 RepID=UPI001CF5C411|nr:synaptotagmin-9-like isoform X3 [Acropora millepora]
MTIVAWIVAYVFIGSLLLATFVYVGVLLVKTYSIRKENRRKAQNYGFFLLPPSDVGDNSTSGNATTPSPTRLEASLKPPTQPPYSVGEMHEIRVQPLLVKRAGHNLPTEPMSPSSPISPRTPGTPRFLEDLGSLDPSLYTMVAEEDTQAITAEAPGDIPPSYNLGQAHFIVEYNQRRSLLVVKLVEALNLSPMEKEWSKPCNPYVIVQLLPDYRHQLQSTVHKKTTNPQFNETFEFEKQVALGELMVSLGYLKSAERLTVVVIKARNLPAISIKGTADAHVKIYLLAAGKRVKKRKTSVRKGTLNPVFNEALSFDIAADALNTVDLMLSVLHENEIIGCISIGSHATGQELNHWREVRTANKPIARWHSLQDPKNFF